MRPRRFVGILERKLLGAAMSAVLFVIERRLDQANDEQSTRQNSGDGAGEPRSMKPPKMCLVRRLASRFAASRLCTGHRRWSLPVYDTWLEHGAGHRDTTLSRPLAV
jgi:hypothetical protein